MVLEAVGRDDQLGGSIQALRRLRGQHPDLAGIIDPAIPRVEAMRHPIPSPTDR
jgi:hypothetical protein